MNLCFLEYNINYTHGKTRQTPLPRNIFPFSAHWKKHAARRQVMVSMLQMLLWFALLQLVLGYYSGALGQNQVSWQCQDHGFIEG